MPWLAHGVHELIAILVTQVSAPSDDSDSGWSGYGIYAGSEYCFDEPSYSARECDYCGSELCDGPDMCGH